MTASSAPSWPDGSEFRLKCGVVGDGRDEVALDSAAARELMTSGRAKYMRLMSDVPIEPMEHSPAFHRDLMRELVNATSAESYRSLVRQQVDHLARGMTTTCSSPDGADAFSYMASQIEAKIRADILAGESQRFWPMEIGRYEGVRYVLSDLMPDPVQPEAEIERKPRPFERASIKTLKRKPMGKPSPLLSSLVNRL